MLLKIHLALNRKLQWNNVEQGDGKEIERE